MDILFRYLHFIGLFGLVAAVFAQQIMVKRVVTKAVIRKVARIDIMLGMSALVVIITGLMQWFVYGKAAEFFTKNWIFHTKLTLFLLVAVLSLIPTFYFMKNKKGGDDNDIVNVPAKIRIIIMIENTLIFIIPLLAILMARGVGAF